MTAQQKIAASFYQRSTWHEGGFVIVGPGIYEDEDADPSLVLAGQSVEQQRRIVRLMDAAYSAGKHAAQSEVRRALGIDN